MPEKVLFGHYEITTRDDGSLVELGRGAMGITYRAWDTSLECPVALKVINTSQLHSPSAGQRLVREARAAARLRHRHVASVFHLGIEKDVYFYAMELLNGETIEARVNREGPLDVVTTVRVATQVARALNAAQEHQLVHRDIKPANLMLVVEDDEAIVKVIDFGLAKGAAAAGAAKDDPDSIPGFVGTPQFASPEQMQEKELDGRSDIYSLGVSMWFMLTGRVPFGGPLAQVMSHQLNAEPPFAMLGHVPPPLVAVLRKMLAKTPARRPQSAAALRKMLEKVLEEIGGPGATAAARGLSAGTTPRREKYSTTFRTGVVLQGRYRILGEVGEEKLGRAFQVEDAELLRESRLVIVHRHLWDDAAAFVPFQDEVARAVPLEHPNLLRVYGLEAANPGHLLLLEWTNGFSLLSLLRNRRKLDAAEALPLLKHAATGLDYAIRTGLKQVSLSLSETLVHFPDTQNVPSQTLLIERPVADWPGFHVRLQPLAGVRGPMPDETWGGDQTVVGGVLPRPSAADDLHGRYLRELGTLTYELLGGTRRFGDRYVPLAAITEEGNEVLRRALMSPESFATARRFYDELHCAEGGREDTPERATSEDIRFQCGNCGQWMVIDAQARGADIECPTCGKISTVEPPAPVSTAAGAARSKPKILLVEDNEMSRDMLSRRLQKRQYDVVLAIDGVEGLQMAQLERPDLILMDMNLPLISGWQVTRQLKSMPEMQHLPIIALTAYATAGDEEKAREAGCDDFEAKPLELPRLLQKIKMQLLNVKQA